ncbi:LANO_0H15434g1_1 [Lachancea nothofagi CBS 11611]|uniref:LANO_0H15434g1_1 n=1 Tax=Lachancea nothofagi CBS 11611 TaxID=1266666 RepID=A0A1G4KMS3_9SACH|nr:LANO_0H15434g1_1 [Lachancea nothofagi CBS 11611]
MIKTHLVIVPCHSVWKIDQGLEPDNYGQSFKQWHLAPFQHEGRDHLSFIMHSLMAIDALLEDTTGSLLLFSGSCTKEEAGPVSEAQSYFLHARKLLNAVANGFELPAALSSHRDISKYCSRITKKMNNQNLTVDELFAKHIATEEFALDSLENLLYSIVNFQAATSNCPSKVTIAGFGFKKKRFQDYHTIAIDYPASQLNYLSYEPQPIYTDVEQLEAYNRDLDIQESRNALDLYKVDWYGSKDPLLSKKLKRNPFKSKANYTLPFSIKNPINDDQAFFRNTIQHKMPWSAGAQI